MGTGTVVLMVLAVRKKAVACRLLGKGTRVILRVKRLIDVVPGEILTVVPQKRWRYAGQDCLSGEIRSIRFDVEVLENEIVPLELRSMGIWDPDEEYWGEEDEPLEGWAQTIVDYGPRPQFEMDQIIPGQDPREVDDPITLSNDLKHMGREDEAKDMLMQLCEADLRCLDAHSHLGNLEFDDDPHVAIRHYRVGYEIGDLSLKIGFIGALPWRNIDNRPYLRCMHGFGLCLWRLKRFEEAENIFERMLWLNPSDNQGIRFVIDEVRTRTPWEARDWD